MELLPESLLSLSPFFPFRTKMPFSRSMPKSCPLKSGSPISLITAIQMRRHIKACWLKNRGQKGAAELNRSSSWILLYPAPSCQWSKTFFDRVLDGRARNAEFGFSGLNVDVALAFFFNEVLTPKLKLILKRVWIALCFLTKMRFNFANGLRECVKSLKPL